MGYLKNKESCKSTSYSHWSVNSQFISDVMRTRKNPNLKESNKQLFEKATNQSLSLLQQMFKESAGVKKPSLVYRGVSMRQTQLDEIIKNIQEKGFGLDPDQSFQSNTTDFDLAMQFAMRISEKSSDKVPVIHYAITSKVLKWWI